MCETIKPGFVRDYVPEVRSLLRAMNAAGIFLRAIDNGGGNVPAASLKTSAAQLAEITAADDCRLSVICPDGKGRGVYLVFGNSPGELVADYLTGCPVLERVITAHADKWETRRQPVRFMPSDRLALHNARAAAYSRHYAACQAGGMPAGECHSYAAELAEREISKARGNDCTIPLADRIKQGGAK